jgi:AraC family transcriptional activator of pobA
MRSNRHHIPTFSLYGEAPAAIAGQLAGLHIETIQSRSRKYLWKIDDHRHTRLSQCVMVTSGPVSVSLDEVRADLAEAAVMIIPAGTVHSFKFRPDTQGLVLTMDLNHLLKLTTAEHRSPIEDLFSKPRAIDLRADAGVAERVRSLLERLDEEFRQPESALAPTVSWLACCALWILGLRVAAPLSDQYRSGHDVDRLRRFRLLIESYYLKRWAVDRYARRLALSETSLNRLCRRLAGCTAFGLVQQRLAVEAQRRLVYGASSVRAIGSELGFKDPAYFSRFFRRHCGISPNEFRRRHGGGKVPARRRIVQ